jgi:hypothetical protein
MNQHRYKPAPILIWTRFSLVNKNISPRAWQIGRGVRTEDYIRSVVADERRLRPRAEIFFRHTLPNIDAATRDNLAIRHVAAASDRLPSWLLDRLDEAAIKYRWFRVHKVSYDEDWDWVAALQPTLVSLGRACCRDVFIVATCRLDDDDVLAPAFFEAIADYVKPQYRGFCVSFTRGFCGLWDDEVARYGDFVTWKLPMVALGLAYVGEYYLGKMRWRTPHWTVPGDHMKVDEKVPTILDGRRRLFVRSLHNSNDAVMEVEGSSRRGPQFLRRLFRRANRDGMRKILKKSRPADIREVRELFVTM